MKILIESSCASIIGKVRNNNEDNFYYNSKFMPEDNNGTNEILDLTFENNSNKVFSVFDGMGGEENGEHAAYVASISLKKFIELNESNEINWDDYIQIANKNICDEMNGKKRMGTTVAAIQFCENYFSICNVGDSRIYILTKDDNLEQISVDHTEQKLQEKLNININRKGRLTQYLGIKEEEMIIVPFTKKIAYDNIRKIVISSDGITDMLSDDEIKDILLKNKTTNSTVSALLTAAMRKGGIDNTTVMVFDLVNKKKFNLIQKIIKKVS